jgi:hypothetical protein
MTGDKILLYYCLMDTWTGLGDNTELFWAVLSQLPWAWPPLLMLVILAWLAKSVVTLDILEVIALKTRRMWCTWTATTMVIVHNKEANRGINNALIRINNVLTIKEVINNTLTIKESLGIIVSCEVFGV